MLSRVESQKLAATYQVLYRYSKARSLSFAFQYFFLNWVSTLLPGMIKPHFTLEKATLKKIDQEVNLLLKQDIENIQEGYYPAKVLQPESPLSLLLRLPKIVQDTYRISHRRSRAKTKEFNPDLNETLDDLPRYYRTNFHFQTDGYLSEKSAELYEYEVEMLFSGTADAMRRLIITPMKRCFEFSNGAGLKFLEIGAGTGRSTRFVRLAFPKAKIVSIDLSDAYLKVAKRKLFDFKKIDFIQADGGDLPFKDQEFDAVYSIFLFHELPLNARLQVLNEGMRVLKDNGFLGLVDSIQKDDKKEFNPLLEGFPKNFHEPFYKNYIQTPMEDLVQKLSNLPIETERGFLSKVIWTKKG